MLKWAATIITARRFGAGVFIVASLALVGGVVHAQGVPSPAANPSGTACNPSAVGGLLQQFGVQLGHNLGASDDQIRAALPQVVQELQPQIAAQIQATCGQASASGGITGLAVPPQALLGAAAQALQLDPDTLRGDLQQGLTLSQLALQQGVEPDALADQLTAAAEQLRVRQERETIRHLIDQPLGGQRPPAGP
ncbi:MAG TPA: hypothetical protein VK821_12460 [Dehalococcoidia bacterium]|nr:hypothetical protein [Dehalococcoidia bacterium]